MERSCHEWFLNTAAITALGLTPADTVGYGPASDMVDFDAGHWWETGMNLLLPKLATVFMSPHRLAAGLRQLVAYLHRGHRDQRAGHHVDGGTLGVVPADPGR